MSTDVIYRKKNRNIGKSPVMTTDGITILLKALELLRNPSMRKNSPIVWGIADSAIKEFDEINSGLD